MHTLLRDLSYTLRQLRRSPGFAITTVLTLTMAIAANVVVFGVLNALLFHPLPVPQPQQIMQIQGKQSNHLVSLVSELPRHPRPQQNLLRRSRRPHRTHRPRREWNRSTCLGIRGQRKLLRHARHQTPAWTLLSSCRRRQGQRQPGCRVELLRWRVRFAGDPHIVGKTVLVNKHPYTILGVAPQNFSGTEKFIWPEIWVPYHNQPEIEGHSSLEQSSKQQLLGCRPAKARRRCNTGGCRSRAGRGAACNGLSRGR